MARTNAEFGKLIRKALKGRRVKKRRLYDRKAFGRGYLESDRDFTDNNMEVVIALLEALSPG